MTYYPDLSLCAYFGTTLSTPLIAIGWLEAGHAFPTGASPAAFIARLASFASWPWEPLTLPGIHRCDQCPESSRGTSYSFDGKQIGLGSTNLFIPSGTTLFVAPSLVLHYISEHSYLPPTTFQDAVIRCPRMGSSQYLDAVKACGLRVPERRAGLADEVLESVARRPTPHTIMILEHIINAARSETERARLIAALRAARANPAADAETKHLVEEALTRIDETDPVH